MFFREPRRQWYEVGERVVTHLVVAEQLDGAEFVHQQFSGSLHMSVEVQPGDAIEADQQHSVIRVGRDLRLSQAAFNTGLADHYSVKVLVDFFFEVERVTHYPDVLGLQSDRVAPNALLVG